MYITVLYGLSVVGGWVGGHPGDSAVRDAPLCPCTVWHLLLCDSSFCPQVRMSLSECRKLGLCVCVYVILVDYVKSLWPPCGFFNNETGMCGFSCIQFLC